MKKILFFAAVFAALLSSCQNQDELLVETGQTEPDVALRAASTRSVFDNTIKIYRYYVYGNTNSDHYFDTESISSRVIEGRTYGCEGHEFTLSSTDYNGAAVPLYRHYNPTTNDHKLSTSRSLTGFTNSKLLGYIFKEQQPGTVHLYEYYSAHYKDSHYASRINAVEGLKTDETYRYCGIVGYVYPGDKLDPLKLPHTISIEYKNFGWSLNTELIVTYKENGVVKYATYRDGADYWNKYTVRHYQLPDAAILLDATFVYRGSDIGNFYFYNINTPNYNDVAGVARLSIKQLSGYMTIYELKANR